MFFKFNILETSFLFKKTLQVFVESSMELMQYVSRCETNS